MHLNVSSSAIFGLDNINIVVVTLKKGGPEKSLGINICESKVHIHDNTLNTRIYM